MRFPVLILAAAFACGCHPLACFIPADLPKDPPGLTLVSNDAVPAADVEIHLDELGIPHIYAQSEPDLAYALGVMHARDRLFQIYLFIHASEGRLTEILGEGLLEIDRENRLLTHGLEEQLAAASDRDRAIVEAYVAGVNEGARMVGRSAEMNILGVEWEPMLPRHVLAIARLQQWDQGVGFSEEMARWRLVKKLGKDSPAALAFLQDSPSRGVPIVTVDEHDGDPYVEGAEDTQFHAPLASSQQQRAPSASPHAPPAATTARERLLAGLRDDIAERFHQGGTGASNSWSVAADKTASGKAVIANDPHLSHSAPGVFYMVDMHLTGDDAATIAGGTFPGLPCVLIGHGDNIAWGITNAFADTQDVVVIERRQGVPNQYVVDGENFAFGEVKQSFKMGKAADAAVVTETWLTTIFGPTLPPGYGSYGGAESWVDEGEVLALLWTATTFPEDHAHFTSALFDLAKADNVEQATAALQDFTAPAMSVNMAFTDGTIAYRLTGIVPQRGDDQRADFPRLGKSRASGWIGRVPAAQKPQMTNPAKGYINASNQRIVENGVLSQEQVGFEAARPWRALRIDTRLRELLEGGNKPAADDILAIQQDVVDGAALEVAAIYGAHCAGPVEGHDDERVSAFCAAIADFDGKFTKDATAIPYARFAREFQLAVGTAHLGPDLGAEVAGQTFAQMAIHEAIRAEHADPEGAQSPLFDDPATPEREGLDGFCKHALKNALDAVVADAGGSVGDWRWGKLHTLSLRGALVRAPVIGFLFETKKVEEDGTSNAPRAENNDFNNKMRVSSGAGLRLIAEMTEPPTVRMINDSGQSGHFGHPHVEDQNPLWSAGTPRQLTLGHDAAAAGRFGMMTIKPKR